MTPAAKWVKALRSGEYKQTIGTLADEHGYCCLGVACEIAVEEGVISYYKADEGDLPIPVRDWLGLSEEDGTFQEVITLANGRQFDTLIGLNDEAGYDFNQIAEIIESAPEGLFK